MKYKKPKVIAEIGCNHKGDFNIALELLKLAKECGADVAKFQKRNNKELLTEEQYNAAHPNKANSYGLFLTQTPFPSISTPCHPKP